MPPKPFNLSAGAALVGAYGPVANLFGASFRECSRRWIVLRNSLRHPRDRFGFAALAIYLVLALIIFGRGLACNPAGSFIGFTADPSVYMWFLVWWPYAIAHGLNPFVTDLVWAPGGFNLTWTTGIPLAGILASPITTHWGPIVAYTVLCLLSPALAAWTAFLLCRRITARFWPSLAGGYIFGFSAYMLVEIRSHLPLILIFPVPLAVMLVLRRLHDEIRAVSFVALMALTLAAAFMLWLELFATITFFGAIALALGIALGTDEQRQRIYALIPPLALSYVIALIVASPYLYYFFQPGFPRSPVNSPGGYSADLLNFIVPTPVNAIGTLSMLARISQRSAGDAYFGLPLILIVVIFVRARWAEVSTRFLAWFLLVVALASFGPRLHVGGVEFFGLPWKLMQRLPLIKNALPGRFSMYMFLAIAIIAARWLADETVGCRAKFAGAAALAIFLAPNLSARFWIAPIDLPAFFTDGRYRQTLTPGETVVILPYGASGYSMLWQAESAMYFRMAGGWTSIMPREFQSWPAVNAMMHHSYIPGFTDQLKAFLAHHDAATVLITDNERPIWDPMMAPLHLTPIATGGVEVYRFAPADLAPWHAVTALEMERRCDAARFGELLVAAHQYLAGGGSLGLLSPRHAETLGLLAPHSTNDADIRTGNGLFLGALGNGLIGVGVVGSYEALRPLIAKYRADAARVYFPYPRDLADPPQGNTFMRQLVIAFDRDGLARAAAKASP
jgi:hypothetical protein